MAKKGHDGITLRLCGTATIGTKWQVVIPKEIRDIMKLNSGDSVSFILKDGKALGIIPNNSINGLLEYLASENIHLQK